MPHKNLFKKILFCTDFNTDAQTAFYYALNIAEGNEGSELIIYHVIPEPEAQFWKSYIYEVDDVDKKAQKDIDTIIEETYLQKIPEGISHSVRTAIGNVGEEILDISRNEDIDLIVIGRGSGANMINRLLGDFVKKLIHKASCPVLVIPEG
ncbi:MULTISPECIES: universal stress protein [unclassified Oceanispirochaeta]|uniref:universal stress protein n=1 Tax=unclassified Oceanispirochaeta TaxID=2635722 RepID=UPI000E090A0F|nr:MULTISPECIES: universal stress protein [unclassified Oceanispirochaeta]MBF9017518.1 universal stress protein [Oceanispirochaeta sp. M2]NPD74090.1 universal stress protein [Oceanispirochaeta sp. M1]RDG30131.1 universal stress protein [Oceanispirochaeta sp. M1]